MFYKNENGVLLSATDVYGTNLFLVESLKDAHTYPVDGWFWFNTEDEARAFFNIPIQPEESNLPTTEELTVEQRLLQQLEQNGKTHLVQRVKERMPAHPSRRR